MLFNLATVGLLPFALGAPLLEQRDGQTIPGKYLVVLKPGSVASRSPGILSNLANGAIANVHQDHTYSVGDFKGFAASLTDVQVEALKADSQVAYLEADGIAHTQVVSKKSTITQADAPWGLGRLSHRSKGTGTYLYDSSAGAGTCTYIIDSGVYAAHPEFEGRALLVKSYTGVNADDNGHGTHVAGTIGSKTFGVAKKTKIYAIKALDSGGSGSWSTIIAAIETVVTDSKSRSCPNGVVINMSLGGSKIQSVNDAVAAAVDEGLFFAVAAGNDGDNFSAYSPASEPKAFAVGASDIKDALAPFSNYGSTLGVIAPGVDVNSTWNDGAFNVISGTSMATPHVVGLAAYILGLSGPIGPAALKTQIQSLSTTGAIKLSTGASRARTPNKLAFNGISS
ncbi:subtilisin-like protein [Tothia fuscella]|uniref:Subtilisin-like protein n=1 Tax=Tothia fuscella TaxID=1048955 RepID=A0A9P4TUY2_9PEZI|nr:subtilisin-like protein [Tothia fuscella]